MKIAMLVKTNRHLHIPDEVLTRRGDRTVIVLCLTGVPYLSLSIQWFGLHPKKKILKFIFQIHSSLNPRFIQIFFRPIRPDIVLLMNLSCTFNTLCGSLLNPFAGYLSLLSVSQSSDNLAKHGGPH